MIDAQGAFGYVQAPQRLRDKGTGQADMRKFLLEAFPTLARTYQAGHLIGDQFGGPNDVRNPVPFDAVFNGSSGAWGMLERFLKDAVSEDVDQVAMIWHHNVTRCLVRNEVGGAFLTPVRQIAIVDTHWQVRVQPLEAGRCLQVEHGRCSVIIAREKWKLRRV